MITLGGATASRFKASLVFGFAVPLRAGDMPSLDDDFSPRRLFCLLLLPALASTGQLSLGRRNCSQI